MSMLQSKWAKFLKLVFVFNNFIFLLLGITTICFGLWGVIQGEKVFEEEWFKIFMDAELQNDMKRHVRHAFCWLIVGAVILVGISLLGFCGGCRENRCILGVFFIVLFLLTIVFIAALVLFYAFPELVTQVLQLALSKEKAKYLAESKRNGTSRVEQNVNAIQTKLHCCLWNETVAEENKIRSCYGNWTVTEATKPPNAVFFETRCVPALIEKVKETIMERKVAYALIVVVTLIVCVVQMILSLYICCKVKSQAYETMK